MCFEGGFKKGKQPPETVGEVFRSLISLCKKKPKSVMMPLLSTGNQVNKQYIWKKIVVSNASYHTLASNSVWITGI